MNSLFSYFKTALLIVLLVSVNAQASIIESQLSNNIVVKIAVTDIPTSLSPYGSVSLDAQYSHLFFDPLVRWGQDKKIEYRLLAKLKTVKKDKIRFTLKKKIMFHSGNLLTSNDVIWSFNHALKSKYLRQKLQHNIKIKRVNRYQFDIQTKLTQEQLLDYLTHIFILDSAYYKKNKINQNSAQTALHPPIKTLPLSGTGPYRVASFYAGVNLRVETNISYWQNQPMFKHLNFVKIKSIDSRLYALLAGDVDISEAISNKNINSVHFLDSKKIYQTAPLNTLFLTINEKKSDQFGRETARNAIHLAINQQGMLKHILKGTGAVNSVFKVPSIATSVTQVPVYNTKRAKYLIKEIEVPEQLSLLVMTDETGYIPEVIFALINMLKKVGLQLTVQQVNTAKQWHALQSEYDFLLSTWHSPLMVPENIYQDIFTNSLLSSYIQPLFKEQKGKLTQADKVLLFEQYQRSDRIIPLFSKNDIWATDKQFELEGIFSTNAIPYWHLLAPTQQSSE
ncbi:ABC transporter substrate-binding protein [Psychromonas hadalis]|uniref:ABC transporter substrate-binding protein n=1 Tax=Psychromonas hadalis TaxID=211669 RepID=UPI0003B50471|nr:ABC transporter substrate-binding protein [Psychromonas hadalis]